jgi:hypothetical protein
VLFGYEKKKLVVRGTLLPAVFFFQRTVDQRAERSFGVEYKIMVRGEGK